MFCIANASFLGLSRLSALSIPLSQSGGLCLRGLRVHPVYSTASKPFQGVSWGNHRTHLVCFPFPLVALGLVSWNLSFHIFCLFFICFSWKDKFIPSVHVSQKQKSCHMEFYFLQLHTEFTSIYFLMVPIFWNYHIKVVFPTFSTVPWTEWSLSVVSDSLWLHGL